MLIKSVPTKEIVMPYKVQKQGLWWLILKINADGSTTVVGKSKTKEKAEASVRARYANEK